MNVFGPVDILGFVGGLLIASSLLPQVILICKTRSTRDISYSYQTVYIAGLVSNYAYFVLVKATAA